MYYIKEVSDENAYYHNDIAFKVVKESNKEEFLSWYKSNHDKEFNPNWEIGDYFYWVLMD